MKKIISLFKRDYEGTRLVYDEVVPGAEWVQYGEGVATVKIDGTSCLIQDGKLYKRYDVKKGRKAPANFFPAQDPDEITGHWPGWVPVGDAPEDKWHRDALTGTCEVLGNGTYELIGPKVQGNPYKLNFHKLILHGAWGFVEEPPRTFDALKEWFKSAQIEGIVWHHPNGAMVKIKRKDFGLDWPVEL